MKEFDGAIADLYDVFVDWPSRLAREIPGVVERLRAVDAHRVLDVGCGTGRHVGALLDEGFDAMGSDSSDAMLARARDAHGARFLAWRLGEPAPESIVGPLDAVIALGNVWPQLVDDGADETALASILALLRPGGVLLMGLKAFAQRRAAANPYLPLLRRENEGGPLFFVRFLDFEAYDDDRLADFHFTILARDGVIDHRAAPIRVWSAEALRAAIESAGFDSVRVSGSIADPDAPVRGEDVFVHARR